MKEQIKKTKLIILTESFPFSTGEQSFLGEEVKTLSREYELLIISSDNNKSENNVIEFDDYKALRCNVDEVRKWEIVPYLIPMLMYGFFWKELVFILNSGANTFLRIKRSLYELASAIKYSRWIKKNGLLIEDAIYYSYWNNYRGLALTLLKKTNPILKIVVREHGYDLYEERNVCCWQPYKRTLSTLFNRIFFVSEHGRNYHIERYLKNNSAPKEFVVNRIGTGGQNAEVVNDVILNKTSDCFLLVSCSSIISVKRLDRIIDALATIKNRANKKILWCHIGDGGDNTIIKTLAEKKLNGKRNVTYHFLGYIDNNLLKKWYIENHPDCFIMTSESEGSPVAMQEALSFGLPIIATDVGGIAEMVEDGINGFLISNDKVEIKLSCCIDEMLELPDEERIKMGTKSYEMWKKDYNSKDNARNFLREIKRLEFE